GMLSNIAWMSLGSVRGRHRGPGIATSAPGRSSPTPAGPLLEPDAGAHPDEGVDVAEAIAQAQHGQAPFDDDPASDRLGRHQALQPAERLGPQLTACFTSAAILASSAAVSSVSAKAIGHMAPSSRCAVSLKPSVAYLVLNFCAGWKKQT